MAAAVCRLFDGVRLDIGPATDDGFYYDFDLPHRFVPEDFPAIEQEMKRLVQANLPFERFETSREEAFKLLSEKDQTYKLQRLADIPEGEPISFYRCGDFQDLCRGPHLSSTGELRAFKLLSVAGSYFRGLETNPMLQRIYGAAAESENEIQAYLARLEEARKRDHRRLGKDLDLFSIHDEVGPGLVHWHPRGARIRSLIEDFWRQEHFKNGYELLYTPHVGRAGLWETSGHLGFYKGSMYAPMEIDAGDYFIKPMNCPFHVKVYQTAKRSYRELPLRWAELGTVYRYEKAGVLHGLLRVRGFTQDDAHIFCAPQQMSAEVRRAVRFALYMLAALGFKDVAAYLATRPAKAIGDPAQWDAATKALEDALRDENIPFKVDIGGGAFYGPKVDIKIRDAIGREWQTSTIQFDFNLPERFNVTYVAEDGREHRPYIVHRALFGSIERFFGMLLEHYAGAFPLWLAPEQVRILSISEKQTNYAAGLLDRLCNLGFRAQARLGPDKIGAKIRDAQVMKIPYMAVVGQKEMEAGTVAVRSRIQGDLGPMDVEAFVERLRSEEQSRA